MMFLKKISLLTLYSLLLSSIFLLLTPIVLAEPLPLFVLAGQSNMVGYGSDMMELPAEFKEAQNQVFWYDQKNEWNVLVPPTEPFSFSGGVAKGTGFGPELSLGNTLIQHLKQKVALVKYAQNGTNLAKQWQPDSTVYQNLIQRIRQSQVDLNELGYEVQIAGFFWVQGESDAKDPAMADEYAQNLTGLIQQIRQDLESPALPFIYSKVAVPQRDLVTPFGSFCCGNIVRRAQRRVAARLSKVYGVETRDLSKDEDRLHFDSQGLIQLGERLANTWLNQHNHTKGWVFWGGLGSGVLAFLGVYYGIRKRIAFQRILPH